MALNRLEKGSILTSRLEGKTKIYQFNPGYPFLQEIVQLVKSAYLSMSADEKKAYYLMDWSDKAFEASRNDISLLLSFWDMLKNVSRLSLQAISKPNDQASWSGKGHGSVAVEKISGNQLVFKEKGVWVNEGSIETSFSNVFRWTLDRMNLVISLEHLRRGEDKPVFLFHLKPSSRNSLTSIDSPIYEKETYFGKLLAESTGLHLQWRVIGLKRNEEQDYYYS